MDFIYRIRSKWKQWLINVGFYTFETYSQLSQRRKLNYTVMDNLYNIQQPKDCFGQRPNFYVLDISKAIKLLDKIEQNSDDTIILKLKVENNIQLKYTPKEGSMECNRWKDKQSCIYPWNWGAG